MLSITDCEVQSDYIKKSLEFTIKENKYLFSEITIVKLKSLAAEKSIISGLTE